MDNLAQLVGGMILILFLLIIIITKLVISLAILAGAIWVIHFVLKSFGIL